MLLMQEWHAQQVASGDAKENSNFQPLGGDWYDAEIGFKNQMVIEQGLGLNDFFGLRF